MIRLKYLGLAVLAGMFIVSGCVTSGTFEKMQAEKTGEIEVLEKEKSSLSTEKSKLEKDYAALKQQKEAVEQKNIELEKKNSEMANQKAALEAASQERQKQYDALVKGLSKEVEKGQLQVKQYQNMLSVDLAEQIFFDSGRAALKAEGKEVLKKVADALKGYEDKILWVVGHTDDVKVGKALQATFPTNWELSVARATNVVRFLQDTGIPPERLVSSGRGEYDPVAPNDTAEGRQKNRRIEIMLIDKSLMGKMTRPQN